MEAQLVHKRLILGLNREVVSIQKRLSLIEKRPTQIIQPHLENISVQPMMREISNQEMTYSRPMSHDEVSFKL